MTNVNAMTNLFNGCSSLIALEIPNFYIESLISNDILTNVNNLKYINIKNAKYNEENDDCGNNNCELPLNYDNKPIIVCQTNKFITNENIYEICCKFNVETEMYESDNYIVLYYHQDCIYEDGFKNQ